MTWDFGPADAANLPGIQLAIRPGTDAASRRGFLATATVTLTLTGFAPTWEAAAQKAFERLAETVNKAAAHE